MPSFLDTLTGTKPVVPTLPKLDLGAEQQKAIAGNLAALPGAEQLAGQSNLFSQQQITQMLNNVLPGYSAIRDTALGNIRSEVAGQLPGDVQALVENRAAGAALSGGTAGSQFGSNITARDLGLTSLQLTQTGLNSAESWLKSAAALYEPSQINVGSMFVSPAQQYSADNEQNLQQFQREWQQNQISAMPAPWASDLKQFIYRAMSAYSGTNVPNDPYSTPGSFGPGVSSAGGLEGGGGLGGYGAPDFGGTSVEPTGLGAPFSSGSGAVEGDFSSGFGGGMAGII